LEFFKSRFCVAESRIIDLPALPVPRTGLSAFWRRYRHCERSEAIDVEAATVCKHSFAISPHLRASFAIDFPLSEIRGRRECRALDAPAAARVV
jgi:hypothetical protein